MTAVTDLLEKGSCRRAFVLSDSVLLKIAMNNLDIEMGGGFVLFCFAFFVFVLSVLFVCFIRYPLEVYSSVTSLFRMAANFAKLFLFNQYQ